MITQLSLGQTGPALPKYEVASIKPNANGDFRFAFDIEPGGTLTATGITLRRLMMTAYNVQGFRVFGGPDWVAARRWDVQAKPDRAASPGQIRQMLQTLLEDRFQLRSHSEKREMPVYELTVERTGSKLQRVTDGDTKPEVRAGLGSIRLIRATMATFASQLSYALGRPVIDKTSVSGEFDFSLEWTPEPDEDDGPTTAGLPPGTPRPPPATQDGPSLFTAVREQLGLRLKSERGPVQVIVIDGVQLPTGN